MNKEQYNTMIQGLLDTMKEKICCLGSYGVVDACKIKDIIADMECFWNSDGKYSNKDYEGEAKIIIMGFL